MKPSDSTNLIEAWGTCLLALTATNEIVCASLPRRQVLGVWPYDSLRGYWCKEQAFGFEAGRRSPRGEGIFEFITDKKEKIYRHLETAIMRLQQGDTQPPIPSPDSETPPVSTSSSGTEQSPPPPPITTLPLKKAASVRALPPTASSNLRRVNTHTGVKKWLNDTYNPDSPSNTRRSLSPLSGEDTYSRTVHVFPQPRNTTPDPPALTYQRLHGPDIDRRSLISQHLPSQRFSNLAEEDMPMYDVAFPDSSARPLPLPPDHEYSILGAPDPSRVGRTQTPPARYADPPPPTATVSLVPLSTGYTDVPIDDTDMIDNPIYGSEDNIIKAIEKLGGVQVTPPSQHRCINPALNHVSVGAMCPAYELHKLDKEATPKIDQNTPVATDTLKDYDSTADENPPQEEAKPVKPYTKIKKKPPLSLPLSEAEPAITCEGDGSQGETPPPLPARLYSMDSTNSDPPNNDS